MLQTNDYMKVEKVEKLLTEQNSGHAIIVHNLRKVYPGLDGNPEKSAVKELSLAIPSGECFGMLGPNGAGKTSFISMVSKKQPSSYSYLINLKCFMILLLWGFQF